ncbi:MAG: hypothetical protein ACRDSE_16035, partial [Pseudonocardiaceae bacterium]
GSRWSIVALHDRPDHHSGGDPVDSLCRRHHRLKDRPGWNFQMIHGDLIITTPSVKRYRSRPDPIGPPEAEPQSATADSVPPPF